MRRVGCVAGVLGIWLGLVSSASAQLPFVIVQRVSFQKSIGGVYSVNQAFDAALTPDGAHLYVLDGFTDQIRLFVRDPVLGTLSTSVKHSLSEPRRITFSPDGANAYVTADDGIGLHRQLVVYARDPSNGRLSEIQRHEEFVGGVGGLGSVPTVSPDGLHLYTSDRISVFARDPATGRLTFLEDTGFNWGEVNLSPDGLYAYATKFPQGGNLDVFARDAGTGHLTLVQSYADVPGISDPVAVRVAPEGTHAYVINNGTAALALHDRDPETGLLTFVAEYGSSLVVGGTFTLSVDATRLVGMRGGGVTQPRALFDRDPATGALTFRSLVRGNVGVALPPPDTPLIGVDGNEILLQREPRVTCPAEPAAGCVQDTGSGRGSITVTRIVPFGTDKVLWRWRDGGATTPVDLGDPTDATDYVLCVYEPAPPGWHTLTRRLALSGGCNRRPCWKALKGERFKYADRSGLPDGVKKVLVTPGADGDAEMALSAKKGVIDWVEYRPLNLPVVAQLHNDEGHCWESTYSAPRRNTVTSTVQKGVWSFKAYSD
jgi:6-phosphogluconolactonase (cycloisomerase 2 family)